MLKYNSNLKQFSRQLRNNMTDSERLLWSKLRDKQICGVQFYRQKPVGYYIVDFYSAKAKLVIELDGSQHFQTQAIEYDKERELYLRNQGLDILRFTNLEIFKELDAVMQVIYQRVEKAIYDKHIA
jgi:very-short-patch-repair endonuclease